MGIVGKGTPITILLVYQRVYHRSWKLQALLGTCQGMQQKVTITFIYDECFHKLPTVFNRFAISQLVIEFCFRFFSKPNPGPRVESASANVHCCYSCRCSDGQPVRGSSSKMIDDRAQQNGLARSCLQILHLHQKDLGSENHLLNQ